MEKKGLGDTSYPTSKGAVPSIIKRSTISDDNDSSDEKDSSNTSSSSSSSTSSADDKEESNQESGNLDLLSSNFDPLAALNCKDISMIRNFGETDKKFDSVEEFAVAYFKNCTESTDVHGNLTPCTSGCASKRPCKPLHSKLPSKEKVIKENSSERPDGISKDFYKLSKRNFAADDPPVPSKMKELSDAINSMKKDKDGDHPMAILKKRIETGRRIKLYIRSIL